MVGNIYIRKVEHKGGKLVNAVVKTYPNVEPVLAYKREEFLKNPVYSRDYPASEEPGKLGFTKFAALAPSL